MMLRPNVSWPSMHNWQVSHTFPAYVDFSNTLEHNGHLSVAMDLLSCKHVRVPVHKKLADTKLGICTLSVGLKANWWALVPFLVNDW